MGNFGHPSGWTNNSSAHESCFSFFLKNVRSSFVCLNLNQFCSKLRRNHGFSFTGLYLIFLFPSKAEQYHGGVRSLSIVGELLFEGKYGEVLAKTRIQESEAEYVKSVELGGIGKRPYTNLRLRLLPKGTIFPSYNDLVKYENTIKYPQLEFFGGWRSEMPTVIKVLFTMAVV